MRYRYLKDNMRYRYFLYKAVKYQVITNYGEHGYNIPELWDIVTKGKHIYSEYWKDECIKDYMFMR